MKKLLFATILLSIPLFAQDEEEPPFTPFGLSGSYVDVSPASFRTSGFSGQEFTFKQAEGALAYTQPLTPFCGLIFGAGYVATELDWKENPEFNETDFGYVNLSLGAFTKSFPDWFWSATVGFFLDIEELSLSDYTLYQGVLYGQYTLNPCTTIHIGFISEFGLDKDKIWPILGFVLTPCETWRLAIVYPVDISCEYFFSPSWSVAASARFLRNRHRLQENEPNPQGIFQYQTWGAEGDLIYKPCPWINLKAFAGTTFDGDLKVTNRNDNHGVHYKFKGSFYWGVSGFLTF